MHQLIHLIKHDFKLLSRNKIVGISVFVSIAYVLSFKGLTTFGNMDKLLVLVIFNDPALLGFLFIGVMLLFEKNENTFQALLVTPVDKRFYILSKSISLTLIATFCCIFMGIATKNFDFNLTLFILASLTTSMLFSFIGFWVVIPEKNFNRYLLKALGWLLLLSIPFLGYFEVTEYYWYVLFPTQPAIDLFSASLNDTLSLPRFIYDIVAMTAWLIFAFFMAYKNIIKNSSI